MTKKRDLLHRQAFENQGETYVRKLAEQHKGQEIGHEASAWLGEQQALREEASAAKRDKREEETLSIARKALANSRRSNIIAIIAIICAAAATISAAIIGVMLSK